MTSPPTNPPHPHPHTHPATSSSIPQTLIYGTAWKKANTSTLVYTSLKSGFHAIDTAAQPRHYEEGLVGEGIQRAISERIVRREDLYIQTKYTPISGQDPDNVPYDPKDPIDIQVHASIASSLKSFTFTSPDTNISSKPYIDTVLLHSPLPTKSLTLLAWTTLSSYVPHQIRNLGISNTTLPILQCLGENSTTLPAVVQNRFYEKTNYDIELRRFCRGKGVVYQCFWTLTGNPGLVKSEVVGEVGRILEKLGVRVGEGRVVGLYALVLGLGGVSVLDGTTREERMVGDVSGLEMVRVLREGEWSEKWPVWMREFRRLIGEGEEEE